MKKIKHFYCLCEKKTDPNSHFLKHFQYNQSGLISGNVCVEVSSVGGEVTVEESSEIDVVCVEVSIVSGGAV